MPGVDPIGGRRFLWHARRFRAPEAAMRLPNLLVTRRGRLAAFFLLYVTEGVPLGFAATAVATQLRRQGGSLE